jgi:hypothetical protein
MKIRLCAMQSVGVSLAKRMAGVGMVVAISAGIRQSGLMEFVYLCLRGRGGGDDEGVLGYDVTSGFHRAVMV